MTYVVSTPYESNVAVPPVFDPALVDRALEEIGALDANKLVIFKDEHSFTVAAPRVKTLAQAKAVLRGAGNGVLQVPFWRLVPEQFVSKLVPPTFAAIAMAIARGLRKLSGEVELSPHLMAATDSELRALIVAIVESEQPFRPQSGAYDAMRRIAALANDAQLTALWNQLGTFGSEHMFAHALSDAQVKRLWDASSGVDIYKHATLRFEALHRGLYDNALLARDLGRVAEASQHYAPLETLFHTPFGSDPQMDGWQRADRYRAFAAAHRHVATIRDSLRRWHEEQRVTSSSWSHPNALFVFALVADDAANRWLGEQISAAVKTLRTSVDLVGTRLGDVLVGRSDADDLLATLGKLVKGKTLAALVTKAQAMVESGRAQAGLAAPSLRWGVTDADAALRVLKSASDPFALIEAGMTSSDPVAVFNAFAVARRLEMEEPKRRRAPAEVWRFMIRGMRTLEKSYTTEAPDGAALCKLIGGIHKARQRFQETMKGWLSWSDWLDADKAGRETVVEELVSLYSGSTNAAFRDWAEPLVKLWRPNHVERSRVRIERLADECVKAAKKGSETVLRSFVFRTDAAPSADTINRLYGPPIGLPADRVPQFEGRAMEHIITVETRLLAPAVRESFAQRNVAAVSVFLSSRNDHAAFAPDSPHAAVVELSAADLAKGAQVVTAGDVTERGVALEAVTCTLPDAVFQGGAKKGSLYELRKLLDRTDFLAPDRVAPRWIQQPEPAGAFLFDLDGEFSGNASLNLGDMGRLFVFEGTAFIQS